MYCRGKEKNISRTRNCNRSNFQYSKWPLETLGLEWSIKVMRMTTKNYVLVPCILSTLRSLIFLVIFFPRALIIFFDNFVLSRVFFFMRKIILMQSVVLCLFVIFWFIWFALCDAMFVIVSQCSHRRYEIWSTTIHATSPPAGRLQYSGVCSHQKSHQQKWSQQTENSSFLLVKNWIQS